MFRRRGSLATSELLIPLLATHELYWWMTRTFWECSSTKVGQLIVAGHSLGGQYAAGFKTHGQWSPPPPMPDSREQYIHTTNNGLSLPGASHKLENLE